MTPSPEMARRVLAKVQRISKPFGTVIAIENNVGVMRPSPSGTEFTRAETGAAQ
jgi:poly-gamma-glutamate synthesis protein (capsule biosynthesis protein)